MVSFQYLAVSQKSYMIVDWDFKRNVNINSCAVKEQAYKLLVWPILEYSQTVSDTRHLKYSSWNPFSGKQQHSLWTDTVELVVSVVCWLNWTGSCTTSRCSSGVFLQNPLSVSSSQHATGIETSSWTNSQWKFTGVPHACNLSGLSNELVLPHCKRLEPPAWRSCTYIYSWILQDLHPSI